MSRFAKLTALMLSPLLVTSNAFASPATNAPAEVAANLTRDRPECPAVIPVRSGRKLGFRHVTASPITWHDYETAVRERGCPTPVALPEQLAPTMDRKLRVAPDDARFEGTSPVTGVTLADADCYARWLSERTGQKYAVPTPAQWLALASIPDIKVASHDAPATSEIISGELTSACVKWDRPHPISDPHWVCQVFGRAIGKPKPDLRQPARIIMSQRYPDAYVGFRLVRE